MSSRRTQSCIAASPDRVARGDVEKASALGFSLIRNYPFVDGNKRIGHAALEVFLVLNGHQLEATVDDAERVILGVAAGTIGRDEFAEWIRRHIVLR